MAFTLHQLLTETAARQPEHEAGRLMNEALTCGQLYRLSNQVAHSLIANGVTRGDRVGIYLLQIARRDRRHLLNHEDRGVLCAGGCQCPRSAARGDWSSVPALLQALGRLEERDLAALHWVLFAGEVFSTKHLRTLMEKLPHPRYPNLCGPTETNVCAYYEVEPLSPEQTAPVPIGKACANTDLIPINAEGKRVVTTNEQGLLYARGSAVMQGTTASLSPPRRVSSPTPLPRAATTNHGRRSCL